MNSWILYAVSCSLLWGTGYTILKWSANDLSTFTINTIYGIVMVFANLTASIIANDFSNYKLLQNWKVALSLSGYIILFVTSSFLYLMGYKLENTPTSTYTAITSTYPAITFTLSFVLLNQRDYNYFYAIPGLLLIIIGTVLLSLSNK